ncbi:MAG: trypsin-like peptidase domain-containing protein, partial [Planctomycetes bacterium]|nr:trypsin-like peptidase domain-containing protein [Planctomycetota bacterium]
TGNASLNTEPVPRTGNVQYELPPGSHTILIDRRGFEPFKQTIAVIRGEKYNLTPSWKEAAKTFPFMTGIAGYEDWLQDLDQAMQQAAKEKKDIMIAFVTSDEDLESAILRQEVFNNPRFQQICKPKFVRVVIDLPTTERGFNNLTDSAHNDWVRKHYGIDSGDIPSVILTDAKGRPYVNIPGYEDDGGSTYINEFAALSQDREQRDRLLASVAGANAQAKWKAAVEATNWLWEQNIAGFYVDDLTRWLALGQQFDANNARGEHEIVFEAEWTARLHHARIDNRSRLNSIVAELDRWKQTSQFKDANRGARVHLTAAISLISLDAEVAVKYIDEALAYNPTDQSLKTVLQMAKEVLVEASEAGTGTGFVVADGGYILTNYHVIEGPGKVEVLLPDSKKRVAARIIQQDAQRDMALLKIDLPDNTTLKPLDIYGERVGLAADIAVFGFPLGDEFGDNLKATRGIINGLPTEESDKMYLLDCRINPGNSGGPLCNNKGQVIGMVTAKTISGDSIDSLGMAIPADDLMAFIKRNVANYKPGGDVAPKDPLSWEVVAKQVGPSILMVLKSGN